MKNPSIPCLSSDINIHPYICLETFWTVFTCNQCWICAYFSHDSDQMAFSLEEAISRMRILARSNGFEIKKILNWGFISYKYVAFNFIIYSLMDWSVVDYLEVLWITHSDGTHSLQRIHWWASDGMLNYSKSIQIKKQTHLHLEWPEVSKFSANFHF